MILNRPIKCFDDLKALFHLIAVRNACINSFIVGDPDRLLEAAKSKIEYPILVLDLPVRKPNKAKDGYVWVAAFEVLLGVNVKDNGYQEADDKTDFALKISQQIISFLKKGIEEEKHKKPCKNSFDFGTQKIVCDKVCGWGWQTPFEVDAGKIECTDLCSWNEDKCLCLYPEFCFTVDKDCNLILENKSLGFDEIEWTIKPPNQKAIVSTELSPDQILKEQFKNTKNLCYEGLEVILKVSKNLEDGSVCCKYARKMIFPCPQKGCSSPWHPINCDLGDVSLNPGGY